MSSSIRLMTRSQLGEYSPMNAGITYWFPNTAKPPFSLRYVPYMTRDPAVMTCLRWIRGRIISQARFRINDDESTFTQSINEMTREAETIVDRSELNVFVGRQLTRFWRIAVNRVLSALAWGFSGAEVIYRARGNWLEFDNIRPVFALDAKPVSINGQKVGIIVNRVPGRRGRIYIGGPKTFWFVVQREMNPWFGESRLLGAYEPWYELYTDGGAKDVRRLYYYKYAFRGDSLYYPPGTTPLPDEDGGMINNKTLAARMVEKRRSGAVSTFPNIRDVDGNRLWEWVSPEAGPGSVDVRDYYEDLRNEIREGLGVPPEIFQATETGSGFSGRAIPFEGFDASLQEIINDLVEDFDRQICQPLVRINFGREKLSKYEIVPLNIGDVMGSAGPGGVDDPSTVDADAPAGESGEAPALPSPRSQSA